MKIQNAGRPQRVKIIRRSVLGSLLASLGFLAPALALAQTSGAIAVGSVPDLFNVALGILNGYVVPIIFAIAFVMFLFGVYVNFIAPGASEEASKKGGQFVIWSIIGFVLMFSIWGLINIFINTFALQNNQPTLPGFGVPTSSSSLNGGGGTIFGAISNYLSPSSSSSIPANQNGYYSPIINSNGSVTSGGLTYPAVAGSNGVVQPVNGGCPSGYTMTSPTQCTPSGNVTAGPSAVSGIPNGGACSTANGSDGNCEGALICTNGRCQPDPSLENGDGTLNSACVPPGDCDGNMICDTNSDTCQNPNTPGVNDGTNNPTVGNGTLGSSCVPPGDCDGDMVCDTNSDTCEEPSTTNVNDGGYTYCDDGSTVPSGSSCVTCPNGSTSANSSLCPVSASSDSSSGNGSSYDCTINGDC
jgi:hypothetical protein